jgi:hypothetical protein
MSIPTPRIAYSRLLWVGPLALALALAGNIAVWAIASAVIDVSPEFMPLASVGPVIFMTTLGVLGAVLAFAIVGRFARQPARTYSLIAFVALLVSLIPNVMLIVAPAGAPFGGITAPQVLVLMVMHVVAYAACVVILTRFGLEAD